MLVVFGVTRPKVLNSLKHKTAVSIYYYVQCTEIYISFIQKGKEISCESSINFETTDKLCYGEGETLSFHSGVTLQFYIIGNK